MQFGLEVLVEENAKLVQHLQMTLKYPTNSTLSYDEGEGI